MPLPPALGAGVVGRGGPRPKCVPKLVPIEWVGPLIDTDNNSWPRRVYFPTGLKMHRLTGSVVFCIISASPRCYLHVGGLWVYKIYMNRKYFFT